MKKKVIKKFGSLKYLPYLCTAFRSKKMSDESLRKWFFDLLVFYIERKSVVFICQFPFRKN